MRFQSSQRNILYLLIILIVLGSCSGGMKTRKAHQIRQELELGYFQKALDSCQDEYSKNPKETERLNQYIEAIEYIKTHGDKAFQKEDFVSAGNAYALLLKNFPKFSPFSSKLSFERNTLTSRIRASQTLMIEKQVTSHLKTESLQKAIDLYSDLYQQYPQDPVIRRDYTALLELIKTHADLSYEKNDPVLAGCTYRILWKNYGAFNSIKRSLSFNRDLISRSLKTCEKQLFEKGLEQYRAGNLNLAITIWKNILIFDPENQEVKKALHTAIRQSKSLEKGN